MEELTGIQAIKRFFHPIENREILALSKEDRAELGPLCAAALGATLKETPTK